MWHRAKSYFTGSAGSNRRIAAVISSAVFHDTSARSVKPRFRLSLWM